MLESGPKFNLEGQVDCPVVCRYTGSIPEVVGEAGEYFDPLYDEAIGAAIERVLASSDRREQLVELGRSRREAFSWARCAAETLATYRELTG